MSGQAELWDLMLALQEAGCSEQSIAALIRDNPNVAKKIAEAARKRHLLKEGDHQ